MSARTPSWINAGYLSAMVWHLDTFDTGWEAWLDNLWGLFPPIEPPKRDESWRRGTWR